MTAANDSAKPLQDKNLQLLLKTAPMVLISRTWPCASEKQSISFS